MELQTINFSFNWNGKLNNKAFTTIRLHNPKKYRVGELYNIHLKGIPQGTAELKAITVLKGRQFNDYISYMDTGYSRSEMMDILKRMYPKNEIENTVFDFCLLVYKKDEPIHEK